MGHCVEMNHVSPSVAGFRPDNIFPPHFFLLNPVPGVLLLVEAMAWPLRRELL